MRAILDTHAFLWWNIDDARLSPDARRIMADGRSELLISVASIWEVGLTVAEGRLDLSEDLGAYFDDRLRRNHWLPIAIDVDHAVRAATLPPIHQDPFDRMLVAQAQIESIPIVTTDPAITRYDVETIW